MGLIDMLSRPVDKGRREFLKMLAASPLCLYEGRKKKIEWPEYLHTWQKLIDTPQEAAETLAELWKDKFYEDDLKLYGVTDYVASPKVSLLKGGDCEDAALCIALAVEDNGYTPWFIIFATDEPKSPYNHAVYPFYEKGNIRYVTLTNYNLNFRRVGTHAEILHETEKIKTFQELLRYYSETHAPPNEKYTQLFLYHLPSYPNWQATENQIVFSWNNVLLYEKLSR
jgi:hypothetical protein